MRPNQFGSLTVVNTVSHVSRVSIMYLSALAVLSLVDSELRIPLSSYDWVSISSFWCSMYTVYHGSMVGPREISLIETSVTANVLWLAGVFLTFSQLMINDPSRNLVMVLVSVESLYRLRPVLLITSLFVSSPSLFLY